MATTAGRSVHSPNLTKSYTRLPKQGTGLFPVTLDTKTSCYTPRAKTTRQKAVCPVAHTIYPILLRQLMFRYIFRQTHSHMKQPPRLRLNGLVEESIVDGPGLRFVLFAQGCPHHCVGCHNPETHDPQGGYDMTVQAILEKFMENPLLAGITFSGGEPFCQPLPLCSIAQTVHAMGKNVVTYTGFTYEALLHMAQNNEDIACLLQASDILIDGPYVESLRSMELRFRGSTNQRILTRKDREALYL